MRKSLKENVLVFKQVEEKRDNYTGLCKALRRHFKMFHVPFIIINSLMGSFDLICCTKGSVNAYNCVVKVNNRENILQLSKFSVQIFKVRLESTY